jgi:subtilisin family serine protease
MIDTGINPDHPSLADRNLQVHQIDLGTRDAAGRQHGTAIAAMLVGNVEGRVPGLLPDATLIAVEAFHIRGALEQADAFSVSGAVDLLLSEGVDAINMSFSGPPNAVLQRVISQAAQQGIGLVAAAGNGGPGAEPAYPAAWPEVIAVTAVDAREQIYRQANQGPYVALAAPGVNVWTAASVSGGRLRSGTSYAAPFVTAALAVERLRVPEMGLDEITRQLFACARDLGEAGFDPVFGHGLLSAPGQCDGGGQVFSVSGE